MNTNLWPTMPHLQPAQTKLARLNVEPPIARAEHLQAQLRQLRQDRDEYRRLLLVTEQLIADYEVLVGVPF